MVVAVTIDVLGVCNYPILRCEYNADWTWQPMNYNSAWGAYYYTGAWGGYGVNINTVPSDTGSEWFDMSSTAYNNDWSIGQTITFIYDPSSDTVTYQYY